MIMLTRLNGQAIAVNPEVVETFEATPDTVICFTNGNRLAVRETMEEVVETVMEYRRRIHQGNPQELRPAQAKVSNES